MIEAPWWLVVLPMAATPVVYLARRWSAGAYLAAFVSLFTGLLAAILPPTNLMHLAGRTFLLDPLAQHSLALFFVTAAVLYLAAQRFRQGGYFVPLGLFVSGLFAIAAMSRHLGITGFVMTLAAIASVPIIQGDQTGSIRAAWRFLVFMSMALPLILLAAWRVDLYREDPQNAVYLAQAAVFLGMGIAIWLAAVPVHSWMTMSGAWAPPMAGAFVLIGFPMMAVVTLAHLFAEATWFAWWSQAGHLLLLAGLASTTMGGLMAAVQRTLRSAIGYAALFDLGCLLLAAAVQSSGGAFILYAGLVTRAIGLLLTTIATSALEAETPGNGAADLRGAARRQPMATAALLAGGFTLAGLPLTAAFPARWFMLHDLAQVDQRAVWAVMLAGVGVAIFYVRVLRTMLEPPAMSRQVSRPPLSWLPTTLLAILALLTLGLGVFPEPLLRAATRLATIYPLPHL
jgi:NADH:ubiquinone oxidoreductase subunit 2 (subunit N)